MVSYRASSLLYTVTQDMLASCAYHAGAALKDNEHPENLEDVNTSLEASSRNLTNVIQSLDDRHFVSVKHGDEETMIELPFLKNARRMVSAVFLKRCEQLDDVPTTSDRNSAKLNDMIAAPSVRTINALLSLGILSRTTGDNGAEENKTGDQKEDNSFNTNTSINPNTSGKSTIAQEVSMRCAAVVACWQLANAIQQVALSPQNSELQKMKVTPIQLSIFLDTLPKPANDSTVTNVISKSHEIFVPHETGQKW